MTIEPDDWIPGSAVRPKVVDVTREQLRASRRVDRKVEETKNRLRKEQEKLDGALSADQRRINAEQERLKSRAFYEAKTEAETAPLLVSPDPLDRESAINQRRRIQVESEVLRLKTARAAARVALRQASVVDEIEARISELSDEAVALTRERSDIIDRRRRATDEASDRLKAAGGFYVRFFEVAKSALDRDLFRAICEEVKAAEE